MSAHALLSPSSAAKWMGCPGSIAEEAKLNLPDTSSPDADTGTAAHFLAAFCFEKGTHPASYIGKQIAVGLWPEGTDRAVWLEDAPDGSGARRVVNCDVEFVAYVNHYVFRVRKAAEGRQLFFEQRLPISQITGEKGAEGTADALIFAGKTLEVWDLKFGFRKVDAERNKQLMLYALAALDEYGFAEDFDRVKLVIDQPRVSDRPSVWECSIEDLEAFRTEVAAAAQDTREPFPRLQPSEEACQWCKAKATCPALAEFVTDAIGVEFENVDELELSSGLFKDPEVLSEKMAACDLVEAWVKAVRAEVERRLLVAEPVPGWKLVAGRKPPRKWADEVEAEAALKSMKLKREEMYSWKLISPTQAEKLFGKGGLLASPKRWARLEAVIAARGEGSVHVAPEADPRPAYVPASVEDFDNCGDDLA